MTKTTRKTITETAALVDELTDLREQIATLQAREETLKAQFRGYGVSAHIGTYTEVTVAECRMVATPDADLKAHYDAALAAVKATLGASYVEEHTQHRLSAAAVSVTARKVTRAAA